MELQTHTHRHSLLFTFTLAATTPRSVTDQFLNSSRRKFRPGWQISSAQIPCYKSVPLVAQVDLTIACCDLIFTESTGAGTCNAAESCWILYPTVAAKLSSRSSANNRCDACWRELTKRVLVLPLAWVADGIVNFTGWPYAEWNHASTWQGWNWWKSGPVCAVFPDLSSMAMLAPWCPWPADCLLIWKHYDSQTNKNTFRHLFQDLHRSMIGWSSINFNQLTCMQKNNTWFHIASCLR